VTQETKNSLQLCNKKATAISGLKRKY